jgi:hypothetical protein
MLNFPLSPTLNQTYAPNETTWKWDGISWTIQQPVINLSGDASGSSLGNTLPMTLSTVVSSGVYGNLTVDSKGRIVAIRAMNQSDVTGALGYTPVSTAGSTMTGPLTLSENPTADLHAATKAYVDSRALFALAVGLY